MIEFTKPNSRQILIKYLKEHGISQAFLARKMHITPATMNYHLHGTGSFTVDFALSVAMALNISPDIFLNKSYKKLVTKEGDKDGSLD